MVVEHGHPKLDRKRLSGSEVWTCSVQFGAVWPTGSSKEMRVDSAEILFQSFLREAKRVQTKQPYFEDSRVYCDLDHENRLSAMKRYRYS